MEFYAQQQLEERRRQEDEAIDAELERYLAAHPGYGQCPQHPERPVVDAGVSALRHCAECVADAQARYADPKTGVSFGRDYRYVGAEQTGTSGEPYRHMESK